MAPKRKELTLAEKKVIAELNKAGLKGSDIARQTGHPLPTIYGVLRRSKDRGTVENQHRSGRPSFLTERDSRRLGSVVKLNRKRLLQEISSLFNEFRTRPVSKGTLQRKLYEEGYHKCVVKKGIKICVETVKKCLAWCKLNIHKTVTHHWKRVIFSDCYC